MFLIDNTPGMLTLVSLVLISWLVSYGSLGLFLAHCSDWRWRLVAAICAFGPVYAAEAYELSIAFVLQTTLVFGFARLALGKCAKPREGGSGAIKVKRVLQPNLSDLCLLTLVVAQVLAVFVQVPNLNAIGWISMILIGACSGLSMGVGVLVVSSRMHSLAKFLLVGVVALLAALPLTRFDWLTRSFLTFEGWPPEAAAGLMHTNNYVWSTWLILQPLTTFVCIWLMQTTRWFGAEALGSCVSPPQKSSVLSKFAVLGARSVWFGAVAFTLAIYFLLCQPIKSPPMVDLPSNSYQEFASAAQKVAETDFVKKWIATYDGRPSIHLFAKVFADLEDVSKILIESKLLLDKPMAASIEQPDDVRQGRHSDFHVLSRSFVSEGEYCRTRLRHDEAADWYLASIRLGFAVRKGGLLVDESAGRNLSYVGQVQLFRVRSSMSPETLIEISGTLTQLVDGAEPFEAFLERERYRDLTLLGWHARLFETLSAWCGFSDRNQNQMELQSLTEKAELRLIATELAMEAFRKQRERWPNSLGELVPDYLPSVPKDPLSPEGSPLRVGRRDDKTVLVYSVGADGVAQEHETFVNWDSTDDDLWIGRGFPAHFQLFGH